MEDSVEIAKSEGPALPLEASSVNQQEAPPSAQSRVECGQGDADNAYCSKAMEEVDKLAEVSGSGENSLGVVTVSEVTPIAAISSEVTKIREGDVNADRSDIEEDNNSSVSENVSKEDPVKELDVRETHTQEEDEQKESEEEREKRVEEELLNEDEEQDSLRKKSVSPEVPATTEQELVQSSPNTVAEPVSMEVEEMNRTGEEESESGKDKEEEMNLDEDKEESNIEMEKGTDEQTKVVDEQEENTSLDDEMSMPLDDQAGGTSTNATEEDASMQLSEGAEESMDQDAQQENTEFVHVESKEKDGGNSMAMADVSQSGEESMEVSSLHDEDPFGGANESGDKDADESGDKDADGDEPGDKGSDVDVDEPGNKDAEGDEPGDKDTDRDESGDKDADEPMEVEESANGEKLNKLPDPSDEGDKDSLKIPVDKEQDSGTASAVSNMEKETVEEGRSASEKPEETSETIIGDKQHIDTKDSPEDQRSLDNDVSKGADEEICIIPDTVPRMLPRQDATSSKDKPPESGERGKSTDSNPERKDTVIVGLGANESSSKRGKEGESRDYRVKSKDDTPRVRKNYKSIDDVADRIRERSASTEDGSRSRPQRQAAKKAESQIKELAEEDSNSNDGDYRDGPDEVTEVEASLQMCFQCCRVRTCRYEVFVAGKARHLCQEECFAAFRKDSTKASKAGTTIQESSAPTGEGKPFVRKCAQCSTLITGDEKNLSWETMDYCNEECLGKYQNRLGSHCANCKGAVLPVSLGKYCVRFGYDIKQFCCSSCLEEFKKGLKVCSYCQKDISSGMEGFLAPVGDKGQFKDFCTQACMEKYDQMSNNQPPPMVMHQCAVCNNEKMVKVEVLHNKVLNKLCSEPCFAAFKFVNAIIADQCDMCKKYFDRSKTDNFSVFYDDASHSFCCKTCMNVYILANRKIVPCNWCKVKKYNFDMIKRVTSTGQVFMMCSLNCLTLYQVSVSAVSSKRIRCDLCHYVAQAQYHLTMSDATIRNFCTYQCVMQFQGQYSKSAPLTIAGSEPTPIPTGGPKRSYPRRSMPLTQNENQTTPGKTSSPSMPVISSVTSLAAPNGQQSPSQGSPAGITTRAAALKMNNNTNIPQNQAGGGKISQILYRQHVIVKPAVPKAMRNKSTLCKPYMHTKGVSCRPHPCAKETQTEETLGKPVLIPVPVPIYVPAPMHMYSTPFPVPVPFPLPVPVPIFIPTTRNSANGIMKEIKRIQEKIPTDPFEAELLMMAEMVAGEKKAENSDSESDDGGNGGGDVSEVPGASSTAEGGFSPEAVDTSNTFGEDMLQMALKMASELEEPAVDLEAALTPSTITAQSNTSMEQNDATESEDDPEPVTSIAISHEARANLRGRKRSVRVSRNSGGTPSKRGRRISGSGDVPLLPPPEPTGAQRIEQEKPDANMCLKYTFGVNAWKQWVMTKNSELEKAATNNRKLKLFKPEILQLTADELNYSLCLFVKEVRKPNGTEYAPDTIYYLCLGIQQYLFENGRIDNIFTDSYYEKFTECLDEVAKKFAVLYNDSQYIVTRVEEEHLWESKQLGAHSPHVLLSTLMFFNTKHFNLTTVDEHMQLSFSHIMKHWKRNPNQPGVTKVPGSSRNVLLRFYPPQSSLDANARKKKVYEQQENEENPLRCPVKLYEFYLSKCPESVKTRNDVFYLLPERSCVPDSPVWYSTMALGKEPLVKMLHRVKMVKEINVALLTS